MREISVAVLLAVSCTIGDPTHTGPEAVGGGRASGGRNAAGRAAADTAGRSPQADGGRGGSILGASGAGDGGENDGADVGGAGGGNLGGGSAGDGSGGAGLSGTGGAAAAGADAGEGGTGQASEGGAAPQAGTAGMPPLPSYAGVWTGTTSQGGEIRFVYDGAGLVELSYDWALPICASTTIVTTPSRPPIVDGHLSYYAGGNPSAQFEIDFYSSTEAAGTYTFTLTYTGPPVSVPVCRGSETVTFTATNLGT
jgi:hypothetical protein